MIYLQTILKRHDSEITKKVYLCQKSRPLPGDWCQLVAADFNKIDLHMSDENVAQMPVYEYKKLIKSKFHDTAFNELEELKEGHSKVRDNYYSDFKNIQPYFKNRNISNRGTSLMFSLQSKTVRTIKTNFPNMYSSLLCTLCLTHQNTQEHLILCEV